MTFKPRDRVRHLTLPPSEGVFLGAKHGLTGLPVAAVQLDDGRIIYDNLENWEPVPMQNDPNVVDVDFKEL